MTVKRVYTAPALASTNYKGIDMTFKEHCEYYKSIGFVLIPVKNKKALCKWGSVDPDMSAYYEQPGVDIAVATGPRSGVIAIDVDGVRGQENETTKKFIQTLEETNTRKFKTRSGNWQYLFKSNGNITNKQDIFGTKQKTYAIDIRGNGGLTVIPPSGGYAWINGEKIRPCPLSITSLFTGPEASSGPISQNMPGAGKGARMDWILKKTGEMVGKHRTFDEVLSYMKYKNGQAPDPWDEKELEDKIEYIYNKHKHKTPTNQPVRPVTNLFAISNYNNGFAEILADISGAPEVTPEFTTGFKKLDDSIWGYSRGHLTILSGVSEAGKSLLAQIAFLRNVERGKKCLMFSAELMKKDVYKRMLIHRLQMPSTKFNDKTFSDEQRQLITDQIKIWQQYGTNMLICAENLSPEQIDVITRREKPEIIFIDYWQNLLFEGEGHMYMNKSIQLMHALAKDLNIPVVVLSQLHDQYVNLWNPEKKRSERKKIDSHRGDVKMTKALVQSADVLITLNYRHDDDSGLKALRIGVDKNKITGRVKSMFYMFDSEILQYKPTESTVYYGIGT